MLSRLKALLAYKSSFVEYRLETPFFSKLNTEIAKDGVQSASWVYALSDEKVFCFATEEDAIKFSKSFPAHLVKCAGLQCMVNVLEVATSFPINYLKPVDEYAINSVRLDEYNYFSKLVEMIAPPFTKHSLRKGKRRNFTVTAKGVFKRVLDQDELDFLDQTVPLREPNEFLSKEAYSKFQSCSFGFAGYDPKIFGFATARSQASLGLIFEMNAIAPGQLPNVVFTDRNFIYDAGTISRSYEFNSQKQAEEYHLRKQGKTLFAADQLDLFKQALLSADNKDKHNEILAHLRWIADHSCKIFIASDNIETRLWAQEYAMKIEKYLRANNLASENYHCPIVFYAPDQTENHFREYTLEEQYYDIQHQKEYIAMQQKSDEKSFARKKEAHYLNKSFASLFLLDPKELSHELKNFKVKDDSDGELPLGIYILKHGYWHVYNILMEKLMTQDEFNAFVEHDAYKSEEGEALDSASYQTLVQILCHAIRAEEDEYAEFVLDIIKNKNPPLDPVVKNFNPFIYAAEANSVEWIEKLNEAFAPSQQFITPPNISSAKESPILIATMHGNVEAAVALINIVKKAPNNSLIYFPGPEPRKPVYLTHAIAAMCQAAASGLLPIVNAILDEPRLKADVPFAGMTNTSLIYEAASHGHVHILKELLDVRGFTKTLMIPIQKKDAQGVLGQPRLPIEAAVNNNHAYATVYLLSKMDREWIKQNMRGLIDKAIQSKANDTLKALITSSECEAIFTPTFVYLILIAEQTDNITLLKILINKYDFSTPTYDKFHSTILNLLNKHNEVQLSNEFKTAIALRANLLMQMNLFLQSSDNVQVVKKKIQGKNRS